ALGLVDSATQVLTSAGDLSPQPAGSTITQKENVNAYELYFGDTWRVSPSLTLSYGLTWGVQMPPTDPTGKTAMMIDVSTGKPIDAKSYIDAKEKAALYGDVVNPTTAFRIGIDGKHGNVPPLPAVSGGVIIPGQGSPSGIQPANANSVFESRDFRLDPHYVTGGSDSIDFSIQRELPGKMILEVGYVGRWSRDLYGNIDLNSVPYMFTPKGTNQSFAKAFDAVAAQLQAGVSTRAVTTQPAFEAMLGGLGRPLCSGSASVWGSTQAPFA